MKELSLSQTVKSISKKNFDISLLERPDGTYYVSYQRRANTVIETGDIKDLSLANATFNDILCEMEGN